MTIVLFISRWLGSVLGKEFTSEQSKFYVQCCSVKNRTDRVKTFAWRKYKTCCV